MGGMTRKGPVDLSGMDRSFFEALSPEARVELLCRLHALAVEQAEKLARDSSSRPPSSDSPFGRSSGNLTGTVPPPNPPLASPPAPAPESAQPQQSCHQGPFGTGPAKAVFVVTVPFRRTGPRAAAFRIRTP